MLKLLFLPILFIGFLAHAETDKPIIISGFDDVLRQAENTGLTKSALKILSKDRTFAGMPELYQVISSNETGKIKFTVVSGIATWFKGRIEKFLAESHYPTSRLYLRNWLTQWSIEDFKNTKLEKILVANPQRHFIVIFDNSEPSLQIADEINRKHAARISPVYLRQTVFRKARTGIVMFITAFEIALNEYKLERLSKDDLEKVAEAILKEQDLEKIIPSYAYCPSDFDPCSNLSKEISPLCSSIKEKIISLCQSRKLD